MKKFKLWAVDDFVTRLVFLLYQLLFSIYFYMENNEVKATAPKEVYITTGILFVVCNILSKNIFIPIFMNKRQTVFNMKRINKYTLEALFNWLVILVSHIFFDNFAFLIEVCLFTINMVIVVVPIIHKELLIAKEKEKQEEWAKDFENKNQN